ncbi:response regulator transcription factor [Actinophytocola sp.]|uniref:response regulator transcription factor n=1 Tax=Actinophytocola sp. TaxID=1872138 RepID=UPI002D7EE88B|nr:response regulator transcription factor [Actinophytocola sp.]HET9138398.1 response regulator transcription factor [Actinophytocola sp.]
MIKVMLAEDMHMVRGALVALLNLEPDIEVVAEVSSGMDVLATATKHRPHVAVIDIDMPGKDGLTAAAELHDRLPGIRTLILTGIDRPGTLRRALAAKVSGFVLKGAPPAELADAIRQVAAGHRVVDSNLALVALDTAECPLTDREIQVLRLTAEGLEVAEIAAEVFLSPGTVRNYLTMIINKLNAKNRVDAIRIANAAGWL